MASPAHGCEQRLHAGENIQAVLRKRPMAQHGGARIERDRRAWHGLSGVYIYNDACIGVSWGRVNEMGIEKVCQDGTARTFEF